MATIDICLNTICQQRRQFMLFNKPLPRLQPVSPYLLYPNLTRRDFDMRRKAEVLKYSKNSSGGGGQATKTRNYVNAIRGNTGINLPNHPDVNLIQITLEPVTNNEIFTPIVVRYPDGYTSRIDPLTGLTIYEIVPNGRLCIPNTNQIVQTLTTSCGIPGPVESLYLDPSVPLYNYATNVDAFSQIIPGSTAPWSYSSEPSIVFNNNITTNLVNLVIQNQVNVSSNYFRFNAPFGIFVDGFVNPTLDANTPIDLKITATIKSVAVLVYFNDSVVPLQIPPSVSINTLFNSFSYDISFNKQSPANTQPPDSDNYHLFLYMGNISVSNLYLRTSPSYVYNIKLRVNVVLTGTESNSGDLPAIYRSYFTSTNYGVICNIDPTYLINQNNCMINAVPATLFENDGFYFSG
jgi:hypothetical protein